MAINVNVQYKTVSYEEILGLEGSKISWEKNPVSYEEIFRQIFLRKFWLEFSQPRKF